MSNLVLPVEPAAFVLVEEAGQRCRRRTLEMTGQDVPIIQPSSQRLWSEEVAIADARDPLPPKDVAYEFSNGRKFDSTD